MSAGPISEELLRKQIRAEIEHEVRTELAERWIVERAVLVDTIEKMIAAEIVKLKETR